MLVVVTTSIHFREDKYEFNTSFTITISNIDLVSRVRFRAAGSDVCTARGDARLHAIVNNEQRHCRRSRRRARGQRPERVASRRARQMDAARALGSQARQRHARRYLFDPGGIGRQ